MKLVIGLGNPTSEYEKTRHNLGFMCLDKWAVKHNKNWTTGKNFAYITTRSTVLMKPATYMNCSGMALQEAMQKWKASDTLVVYDDLELEPAQIRIRNGGGDGGHNGIASLFTALAPDQLKRIRIGIGKDETKSMSEYVLSEFSDSELEQLKPVIELAVRFVDTFIKYDFNQVLNEYSRWKKSYSVATSNGIISPKEENNDKGL